MAEADEFDAFLQNENEVEAEEDAPEDPVDEDGALDGGVASNQDEEGDNTKRKSTDCDLVRDSALRHVGSGRIST